MATTTARLIEAIGAVPVPLVQAYLDNYQGHLGPAANGAKITGQELTWALKGELRSKEAHNRLWQAIHRRLGKKMMDAVMQQAALSEREPEPPKAQVNSAWGPVTLHDYLPATDTAQQSKVRTLRSGIARIRSDESDKSDKTPAAAAPWPGRGDGTTFTPIHREVTPQPQPQPQPQPDLKECSRCHQKFPATTEYFAVRKKGHTGLQGLCRTCLAVIARRAVAKAHQVLAARRAEQLELAAAQTQTQTQTQDGEEEVIITISKEVQDDLAQFAASLARAAGPAVATTPSRAALLLDVAAEMERLEQENARLRASLDRLTVFFTTMMGQGEQTLADLTAIRAGQVA